ncbi:MAG: peptidoglycan glycosyltransferase [Opitutales bacterium]|nr:peptidoglycan glycosyltransferase [Opitutales bacterium]
MIQQTRAPGVAPIRIAVVGVFFVFTFLFLLAGLARLQIFESDEYSSEHRQQSRRIVMTPAPRGEIRDRNGNIIVANRARFSVVADLSLLRDEIDAAYVNAVRKARKQRSRSASVRIDRDALLNTARIEVLQKYQDRVNRTIGRQAVLEPKTILRHIGQKRTLDFPLAENLTDLERARFIEQFPVNGPVRLYVDSVRFYPYGKLAAHVLGFLVNTEDISTESVPQRHANIGISRYRGKTGATGLEKQLDVALRGVPGYRLWMVHPNGYLYNMLEEVKPIQGALIYTTLDLDLQQEVEAAMATVNRPGAAIVLDVESGEILALASSFCYDPNEFSVIIRSAYQKELVARDANILANRALQGRYPPGSTFKLITAIAALRSGKIHSDTTFNCGSYLRVHRRNWPEHDGASFGECDVARMIRVSSNVFCYHTALEIGWEPITAEARRFGFDKRIALELPEATGRYLVVPSPEYKREEIGAGGWVTGDTLNMSIGQGYLLTSPMHVACMTASIARRETRTSPTIIYDPERAGKRVKHGGEDIGLSDDAYATLLRGMEEAVEKGTGRRARVDGLRIAGKTGTAQWTNRGKRANLAWFTGFAPVNKPKIAVAVVFEAEKEDNMAGGATAGPVAGRIFKKWKELNLDGGTQE